MPSNASHFSLLFVSIKHSFYARLRATCANLAAAALRPAQHWWLHNRAPKTRLASESGWAKRSSGRVAFSAEDKRYFGDLVRNLRDVIRRLIAVEVFDPEGSSVGGTGWSCDHRFPILPL